MKLKPTWVVAVGITVLYFLTTALWGRLLGIDYDTITDSTDGLLKGMVLRVGLNALLFTLIAIYLSRIWNGGIYLQRDVPRLPAWMWILPGVMIAAAVTQIIDNDWGARGIDYVLVLAIGTLLVGINEETTFRGIVVRALRGSTRNEFVVMLASSVFFGLIHAVNIINGAQVGPTITQIVIASLSGVSLYVTLRLTGTLLAPILLHGLFDFSVLGQIGERGTFGLIGVGLTILMYGLAIIVAIAIFVLSRRERREMAPAAA